jgi:hypothetical protein
VRSICIFLAIWRSEIIQNFRLSELEIVMTYYTDSNVQSVLKVALPKYLVVIIIRRQMCIEHAGQQFEQFLLPFFITLYCIVDIF